MARFPCPACGSYNEENAFFCDQCGTALREAEPKRPRRTGPFLLVFLILMVVSGSAFHFLRHRPSREVESRTGAPRVPPSGPPRPNLPSRSISPPVKSRAGAASRAESPERRTASSPKASETPSAEEIVPVAVSEEAPRLWARVAPLTAEGGRSVSFRGAVLEGGLLLCPVEILRGAEKVEVVLGERTFTVSETVGWDLLRGFCLLSLPVSNGGFAPGEASAGDVVSVVPCRGNTFEDRLGDPGEYGLENLPLLVLAGGKERPEACYLLRARELVGVAWYRWPGSGPAVFGRVSPVERRGAVGIREWNENVWGKRAASCYLKGRDAFMRTDFESAARYLAEALSRERRLRPLAEARLSSAYVKWADELSAVGDHEAARRILLEGAELVPRSVELLLVLSREEAAGGHPEDALVHAREALNLDRDLWNSRWTLLEDRYLRLASALEPEEAIKVLGDGADELPESVALRVELGRLLIKDRRYDEAASVWEEAYALSKNPEIAGLIEEARRLSAARDAVVVIPAGEGSGTIRTDVVFGDRLAVNCIVDTGATFTAIPSWAARELGLPLAGEKRVRIATASGLRDVPLVSVDSVSLGKLSVGPLDVLILDLPHPKGESSPGLLGLNFLRNFNVSLDRERRELRISPR